MGIQINSPEVVPAVTYDRVHMTRMVVNQPLSDDDAAQPIYQVEINYRLYGIVNGFRYYKNEEPHRIVIDDYFSKALADYANGDEVLLNAFVAIEQAIAAIIKDQAGLDTTVTQ